MQPRFERRIGKTPYKLLEHPRWRAGYDFLLLRCESGEIDKEIGEWWTAFGDADSPGREALLAKKPKEEGAAPAKKRRRRSRSKKPGADGGPEGNNLPQE
jgi:poly(A) polymerase